MDLNKYAARLPAWFLILVLSSSLIMSYVSQSLLSKVSADASGGGRLLPHAQQSRLHVIDDLRSRKEIRHIQTILERGTSADEQLRVWREKGDMNAVVDRLIEMTLENVP